MLRGKKLKDIAKDAGITAPSAQQCISNSLRTQYVKAEIAKRTKAALAIWSEDEITSRIQDLGQSAKSEANRLRALELLAKVKAMLTEKTVINEHVVRIREIDLRKATTEDLREELFKRLDSLRIEPEPASQLGSNA